MKRRMVLCLIIFLGSYVLGQENVTIELPIGINEYLHSAEFSPDGEHLITTSESSPNKIWEVSTGRLVEVIDKPDGKGVSDMVSYSPDGAMIAKRSFGGKLEFLDSKNTRKIHNVLQINNGDIFNYSWSPNGENIFVRYQIWDPVIEKVTGFYGMIWNVESGKKVSDLKELLEEDKFINWSYDSKQLLFCNQNYSNPEIIIRKAKSGKIVFKYSGRKAEVEDNLGDENSKIKVQHSSFSPSSEHFLIQMDNGIAELYNGKTHKLISTHRNFYSFNNSWSSNGSYLLCRRMYEDESIFIANLWDSSSITLEVPEDILNFSWSKNNEIILFEMDGRVQINQTIDGGVVKTIKTDSYNHTDSHYFLMSPNNSTVMWFNNKTGKCTLFSVYNNNSRQILNGRTQKIKSSSWSLNREMILFETEQYVGAWNLSEANLDYIIHEELWEVLGNNSFLTINQNNEFNRWSSTTGQLLDSYKGLYKTHVSDNYNRGEVLFTDDKESAFTIRGYDTLDIWNTRSGLLRSVVINGDGVNMNNISLTDEEKKIAIYCRDSVFVINVDSGNIVYQGSSKVLNSLYWSPNCEYLIVDSSLVRVSDGKLLQRFKGEHLFQWKIKENILIAERENESVEFEITTGRQLNNLEYSTSFYGRDSIRIWRKGELLPVLNISDGKEVKLVSWSNDRGNVILTFDDDSRIIWNIKTGKPSKSIKKNNHIWWSPECQTVIFSINSNITQILWDVNKWIPKHEFSIGTPYKWTSSGSHLVLRHANGGSVFQVDSMLTVFQFKSERPPLLKAQDRYLIGHGYGDNTEVWDVNSGNVLLTINNSDFKFSPNGEFVIFGGKQPEIWKVNPTHLLHKSTKVNNGYSSSSKFRWSSNSKFIEASFLNVIHIWEVLSMNKIAEKKVYDNHWVHWSVNSSFYANRLDSNTIEITDVLKNESFNIRSDFKKILSFKWEKNNSIIILNEDSLIETWDAKNRNIISRIESNVKKITKRQVEFLPANKRDEVKYSIENTTFIVEDSTELNEYELRYLVEFTSFEGGEYFSKTSENYYKGSKGVLNWLTFKIGEQRFPFSQFDLKYNRPDIVLERLGYASPEKIKSYRRAYEKRLQKMSFTEDMLKADFHIPEASIMNEDELPVQIEQDKIALKINASDSKYPLDRINVWINNVPIYGVNGISLRSKMAQDFDSTFQLQLNEGDNKIEVSVLNQAGAESYKETVYMNCTKPTPKPNLYFVGIGVRDYENQDMNLKYSDKDIRDMAELYSTSSSYGKIYIDTFLNASATKNILPQIRKRLESSTIHDQVIFMYSGHGILDDSLDYYLTTHDIDFLQPSTKGIPYEAVDELLDNIPARQKLVLIDACNSGEVDKDELEVTESSGITAEILAPKGDMFKKYATKTNSFEMMQELFTDLRRGTGATVISSSSGKYFSFEDKKYQNGVYTYALKLGLEGAADANEDNEITVSELKEFLYKKVESLTNGKQKPTARQENLEYDFRVW